MDTTVIYYTANMEDGSFEGKIIDNLKRQVGGLPIISVSRKPIKLGTNICVGEQPVCYSNSWKQLLIGLRAAKTTFCIAAESDCLYPPEYFQFTPPSEIDMYRYTNVWVYFLGKGGFWRKPWSEGAQMCGREYWAEQIENALGPVEGWEPMPDTHRVVRKICNTKDEFAWTSDNPVVSFKTGQGVSYKTSFFPGRSVAIPYWGDNKKVKKEMFL